MHLLIWSFVKTVLGSGSGAGASLISPPSRRSLLSSAAPSYLSQPSSMSMSWFEGLL